MRLPGRVLTAVIRKYELPAKAALIVGLTISVLFSASAGYLGYFFELPLPLIGVLAAAVLFGIVRFGVYKALVNDPPVFHVISLLVGLYIGDYFSSFIKDATPLQEKLAPVSVGVLMFFLTEALF